MPQRGLAIKRVVLVGGKMTDPTLEILIAPFPALYPDDRIGIVTRMFK
jgi:hypothetical protein